jgi:hypothetical protein
MKSTSSQDHPILAQVAGLHSGAVLLGGPCRDSNPDLRLAKTVLYPVELQGLHLMLITDKRCNKKESTSTWQGLLVVF